MSIFSFSQITSPQTTCTLSLFNITDENIIMSVRLPFDQKLSAMEMLRKEKVNWLSESDSAFIYSRHVINRKKIIFQFFYARLN